MSESSSRPQRLEFFTPKIPGEHPMAAIRYAPDEDEQQLTATEAAEHCGVTVAAICNWVKRGHLAPVGIIREGRKVYSLIDVAAAELRLRNRRY